MLKKQGPVKWKGTRLTQDTLDTGSLSLWDRCPSSNSSMGASTLVSAFFTNVIWGGVCSTPTNFPSPSKWMPGLLQGGPFAVYQTVGGVPPLTNFPSPSKWRSGSL